MTLEQIIETLESKHPTWEWLVRRDTAHGYFANVFKKNLHTSFQYYGKTPSEALEASWDALEDYLMNKSKPPETVNSLDALVELCNYLEISGLKLTSFTPKALAFWAAYNKGAAPKPEDKGRKANIN